LRRANFDFHDVFQNDVFSGSSPQKHLHDIESHQVKYQFSLIS
jgi:hypothetical protein